MWASQVREVSDMLEDHDMETKNIFTTILRSASIGNKSVLLSSNEVPERLRFRLEAFNFKVKNITDNFVKVSW